LSGLQGHLSISSLTQNCHDACYCPIDLRAMLSFSALEPVAGKTLSLTAADVYVHQTYANPEVMCMPGDGIGA
jgi:hypothetical protein